MIMKSAELDQVNTDRIRILRANVSKLNQVVDEFIFTQLRHHTGTDRSPAEGRWVQRTVDGGYDGPVKLDSTVEIGNALVKVDFAGKEDAQAWHQRPGHLYLGP